ncbi:MAG: phosphoribosylanthranilate isomerase [Lentisphaeria bacterium]|nr:phosphoribosylanthranilate isomerase [Lentisphaeria bacterium]
MKTEVKICGITRLEDALFAIGQGADYLGFVLTEKSKRFLPLCQLAQFAHLPVKKVGVFVDANLDFIRQAVKIGHLDIVQLHGNENADFARNIDFAKVWKATYDNDFPAERLICDAPQGGSGCPGNHAEAAKLAKIRPIMLAGGINPENAAELIAQIKPAGIDIASGVEKSFGIKDHSKLKQLFERIKK